MPRAVVVIPAPQVALGRAVHRSDYGQNIAIADAGVEALDEAVAVAAGRKGRRVIIRRVEIEGLLHRLVAQREAFFERKVISFESQKSNCALEQGKRVTWD
jgi:hypothetical protein